MPHLTFWYEFASTYSYLSVMRMEVAAAAAGVTVTWQPFLLGPIFHAQGWSTSPFNIYPAKGRYMVRDIERIASTRGLDFRMPETFPANGLKAARLATLGIEEGWVVPFTKAVYEAQFVRGLDISGADVLLEALTRLGLDGQAAVARSNAPENKARLRDATARAQDLGLFGAPSFTTADGELFWGDDRLDQALAHAVRATAS